MRIGLQTLSFLSPSFYSVHHMEYIVEHGRPKDTSNRLSKEVEVYDLLDSLNIEYDRLDHEAIFDMNRLKEVREYLGVSINKNLFLCNTQKTRFYLLLMPGDKPFKTKELSHQINSSRLSFGPEDKLLELLNVTSGSVNIMTLMYDKADQVQLVIDEDLLKGEYFGFHPMINTTSLKVKKEDMLDKYLKHVHHEPIFVTLKGE